MTRSGIVAGARLFVIAISPATALSDSKLSTDEISEIAQEATVFALPMLMNYGVMYAYAVDVGGPQYKAPFNTLFSEANVFTYKDTAVVTPP